MSNRKRNHKVNHHSVDKTEMWITRLYIAGVLDESHTYKFDVYHDDDCNYQNGECSCKPVLRIEDLTESNEPSFRNLDVIPDIAKSIKQYIN